MKDEALDQLSDVQSDLSAITYLVSAVYMGVGDLQAEAADPMRTILDVVMGRLNRARAALANVRKSKTGAVPDTA